MFTQEVRENLGFSRIKAHIVFQKKTMPVTESGCLIWMGTIAGQTNKYGGYGSVRDERFDKHVPAHRFSWELFKGPIPKGMHVCHKCDVRCCVNPDHLFLGTRSDNMQDMVRKKRNKGGPKWGTHCKHGHPRTPENTKIAIENGRSYKRCRLCHLAQDKHQRNAKRGRNQ